MNGDEVFGIDLLVKNADGEVEFAIEIKTLHNQNNRPFYTKFNGKKTGLNKFSKDYQIDCRKKYKNFKRCLYCVVDPFKTPVNNRLYLVTDEKKLSWLPDFSKKNKNPIWHDQDYVGNNLAREIGEPVKILKPEFFDIVLLLD